MGWAIQSIGIRTFELWSTHNSMALSFKTDDAITNIANERLPNVQGWHSNDGMLLVNTTWSP